VPTVEHFNAQIDDDAFAEMAWPDRQPPIAVLAGEQMDLASKWQELGWKVLTLDDLQAKGIAYLIDQLAQGFAGE
jgi:DEAD/DEAH box helicase domain-containing protein